MNNKTFFAVLPISVLDSKNSMFLYNDSIYNFHIPNNLINRYFHEIFTKRKFLMRKGSKPIWGFQFGPVKPVDLTTEGAPSLLNNEGVVLIAYSPDEIDFRRMVSVKRRKMEQIDQKLKSGYSNKWRNYVDVSEIPRTAAIHDLCRSSFTKDLFVEHPFDFARQHIAIPRLRKKNIVGIWRTQEIMATRKSYIFHSESELLDRCDECVDLKKWINRVDLNYI